MINPFPSVMQVFEVASPVCKDSYAGFLPFLLTFTAPIDLKVKDVVLVNAYSGAVQTVQRRHITIWRYASRN
jgi:hypothetical protein